MSIDKEIIDWLMDGDPAIRWQVQRDLTGGDAETIKTERERITHEGWGAQLLSLQDPKGTWAKGLYSPKWTSTTYTMMLLRRFGMIANTQTHKTCKLLLDKGFYTDNGINFWPSWKQSETCVTGMILSILSAFEFSDERVPKLVDHLLGEQMPDGGWNCEAYNGATHSSFHTTISVLEGLHLYQTLILPLEPHPFHLEKIKESIQRAVEFLLEHRLFRSHRTGAVVNEKFKMFSFPPRWHYDILRALDFAQAVGAARDERFSDAIEILRKKRTKAGQWKVQNRYSGRVWFDMEKTGKPSRWNTLRALRVLKWWTGEPGTEGVKVLDKSCRMQ